MSAPRARAAWWTAVVVGLVLGVAAAVGAVSWLHHSRDDAVAAARVADPLADLRSDRLDATLAGLLEDGVVVSDDGRYLLDRAGEADVASAVAASPERVFVVVWAPGQELGAYEPGVLDELTARLTAAIAPARGVLFVWQGPETGSVEELGAEGYLLDYGSPLDFLGDPAVTLPKAVASVADMDWYDDDETGSGSDYWGGWGGGGLLGLLLGVAVVLVLRSAAFLLRLVGGPRLPGGWRVGSRPRTSTTKGKGRR